MRTIEVLSPAAARANVAVPLAPRVPALAGRVVGLLNNSKSGTRPFLDRVEELLRREHGVAQIIRYDKQAAALPIPDEMLAAAAGECDVVVNGIAD
jgi:ABC-type amino acid transport substrate-binding protein